MSLNTSSQLHLRYISEALMVRKPGVNVRIKVNIKLMVKVKVTVSTRTVHKQCCNAGTAAL